MTTWLHFIVVTHWDLSALREWRARGVWVQVGVDLISIDPPQAP